MHFSEAFLFAVVLAVVMVVAMLTATLICRSCQACYLKRYRLELEYRTRKLNVKERRVRETAV